MCNCPHGGEACTNEAVRSTRISSVRWPYPAGGAQYVLPYSGCRARCVPTHPGRGVRHGWYEVVPSPGAGSPQVSKKAGKSIVESKLVANIGLLTDDKDAFRQWDKKMVNVLTHLNKGYGPAITCIKDLVDRGRGADGTYTLPDSNHGMSPDQLENASAVSGLTLTEMVKAGVRASDGDIDTDQLNEDLSFILIDKAKLRSDILQRIQNL